MKEVAPVPLPATVRVPDVLGVRVSVFPLPTTVIALVRPLVVFVEVAIVIVAPVCV